MCECEPCYKICQAGSCSGLLLLPVTANKTASQTSTNLGGNDFELRAWVEWVQLQEPSTVVGTQLENEAEEAAKLAGVTCQSTATVVYRRSSSSKLEANLPDNTVAETLKRSRAEPHVASPSVSSRHTAVSVASFAQASRFRVVEPSFVAMFARQLQHFVSSLANASRRTGRPTGAGTTVTTTTTTGSRKTGGTTTSAPARRRKGTGVVMAAGGAVLLTQAWLVSSHAARRIFTNVCACMRSEHRRKE